MHISKLLVKIPMSVDQNNYGVDIRYDSNILVGCSQGCKVLKKAQAGMSCHGCDAASPAGHLGQDMIKRGFLSPLSFFFME